MISIKSTSGQRAMEQNAAREHRKRWSIFFSCEAQIAFFISCIRDVNTNPLLGAIGASLQGTVLDIELDWSRVHLSNGNPEVLR